MNGPIGDAASLMHRRGARRKNIILCRECSYLGRFPGSVWGMAGTLYLVAFETSCSTSRARANAYLQSISESRWNELGDLWFLKCEKGGGEIRTQLALILGPSGRIVVGLLAGFAAWNGFADEEEVWLAQNL